MPGLRRQTASGATWIIFAIVASGCIASPRQGGPLPQGAVPLAAPPVFQDWYQRTEACSGLRGSWDTLRWYLVPGVSSFIAPQGPVVGLWTRARKSGVIVLAGTFANDELVVRHEMLHALIGKDGHPPVLFVSACHLTWDSWPAAVASP